MVNHKQALESMWIGRCSVIVRQERQNPLSKRIEFDEVPIFVNQPCRLSFRTIKQTTDDNIAAEVTQVARLFITNAITIPAGSKLIITQNGKTVDYERSGEPAIYSNHQEIMLVLFKGWA